MARTELPNGVILPAEYSDDWYEDMTSNLTKLDDVIGSDSEKLNSNDVAFLRMSSAALTDGGTGNFSDLNSSNKLKTGDYVLDSGRKLYQVVSVDSTNETFTVGNSLFKITAESDLAPVAESGDYDDLDNKPDLNSYDQHIANTDIHVTTADKNKWNNQTYVFRYSLTALVASSTNSNALLDNTDNLKVGDKVIDSSGVLFSVTAIDTQNSTFTIGTALIDLALDANVMHLTGNESASGDKNFQGLLTTIPNATLWPVVLNTTDDITFLGRSVIHIEYKSSGQLTNLSGGAWSVAELGVGCFFFRMNNGTDIRFKNLATGDVNRIPVVSGANRFINDVTPETDNTYDLGDSTRRWKTINNINPGALSFPDLNNGLDISGYLDVTQSSINTYTPPVDGWISIKGRSSVTNGIAIMQGDMYQMGYSLVDFGISDRVCFCMLPVMKNVQVEIWLKSVSSLDSAKFFPCQGNI